VTAPLLKFVAEFCFNKSQRLTFDSSSPNGILLFREVSKVVVTYGNWVLAQQQQQPLTGNEAYPLRYKGIWICLQVSLYTLMLNGPGSCLHSCPPQNTTPALQAPTPPQPNPNPNPTQPNPGAVPRHERQLRQLWGV
jgi:hypothetical protein